MPPTALHIDFETRSAVDLKKVGAYKYAEHPSTSIICMSYRFGEGPVQRWRPGQEQDWPDPSCTSRYVAHNAGFERTVWNKCLSSFDVSPMHPAGQDCTMARAAALGLPQSLDQLAEVLNAQVKKDKDGHRLMMKLCRPRKIHDDGRIEWWEDPADLERLQAYCDQDVLTECAVDKLLPALTPQERRVWELDQAINDRGFAVDLPLVRKALDAVEEAGRRADREMWRLTEGVVKRCTEVAKIVAWINSRGIPCQSVAKGEIEELVLGAQLMSDTAVGKVLALRRAAAKSSTSKYKAFLAVACADGRVRGSLAYHAAHTGRWGGRGVQPQNFPRVESSDSDFTNDDVARAVTVLEAGMPASAVVDSLEMLFGQPLAALSKCLRTMIVAPPGKKLIGGDFSNVEGRIAAWFAGEMWKLQAFEAYDRGEGPDLYRVTAARVTGKAIEDVSRTERQAQGKVSELMGIYQGSVGAYVTMAATYLVDPAAVASVALAAAGPEARLRARQAYDVRRAYGLPEDIWVGCKIVVDAWRDANPRIVQAWWDLQDAAIDAVEHPGVVVPVLGGRVKYVLNAGYLWCMLPSGRCIAYPSAHIRWVDSGRLDAQGKKIMKRQVVYLGVDSQTKRWGKHALYGGSQCNHIVQGTARDALVEAMFRVESSGYPVVLTVHDELLSEVSQGFGSKDEYRQLMERRPAWGLDIPLVVAAWEGPRYGK